MSSPIESVQGGGVYLPPYIYVYRRCEAGGVGHHRYAVALLLAGPHPRLPLDGVHRQTAHPSTTYMAPSLHCTDTSIGAEPGAGAPPRAPATDLVCRAPGHRRETGRLPPHSPPALALHKLHRHPLAPLQPPAPHPCSLLAHTVDIVPCIVLSPAPSLSATSRQCRGCPWRPRQGPRRSCCRRHAATQRLQHTTHYMGAGYRIMGCAEQHVPTSASLRKMLVKHSFLMNFFLISLKLMQASQASIPWGMLYGILYHSSVFICRACHSFTTAWSFYVRNPRDSLLADENLASLRSHGTYGRLSDKETVNIG